MGRRIEKAVTENSVTTTTRYLYDGFNIVAEYDANGNITTKYIHGLGIDEPLAMEKNSSTYYYHADGLGSITEITDSTGTTVQQYRYDSFGNIKSVSDPNFIQPYMFTGREYDPESGLLFLRARELDSKTGTFTQKDPIGFGGGDVNLYRYVENDPINYIDLIGLSRDTYKADSYKHGGPHIDRYNSSGQNVGRYRPDGTPIPFKGKTSPSIPKSDLSKFTKAVSGLKAIAYLGILSGILEDVQLWLRAKECGKTFSEQAEEEIKNAGPLIMTPLGPTINPYWQYMYQKLNELEKSGALKLGEI